jgi:pyrimidine deaminase RibD-like protein
MALPMWLHRHIDTDILSQKQRYTTKHYTHSHVAMIFQGRKILAIGQNRAYGTRTIHAEVDVIRALGDIAKLRGATLVVIRLAPSGILNSKPCPACTCTLQKCVRTYGLRGWIHS